MNKLTIICTLIITLLLTACADSHNSSKIVSTGTSIDPSQTVYVSMSEDGVYGDIDYRGSGKNTTQIIKSAVLKKTNNVIASKQAENIDEAVLSAKQHNADFVIYPIIMHWEDRATEWSSIPDKVEIKISIIEIISQDIVEEIIIKGKSGIATFGGDHPQDLLVDPIEKLIKNLY